MGRADIQEEEQEEQEEQEEWAELVIRGREVGRADIQLLLTGGGGEGQTQRGNRNVTLLPLLFS